MPQSWLVHVLEWLELRLYAGAGKIVTVGESYRERLLDRGVDPTLTSDVPNGVDLDSFSGIEPSSDFRARFGLGDRFVCAYIGTIGMAAGLDIVLRAGKLLDDAGRTDICFLLVGDGSNRSDI